MGAALALVSSAAMAFQEQNSGTVVAPQTPAAPAADKAPAADFAADSGKSAGDSGTEVRIPGLGKLGVLPKMDFGLELLYGATETKGVEEPQTPITNEDGDLTIRGTVKHRF